jgi:hypothetical protein
MEIPTKATLVFAIIARGEESPGSLYGLLQSSWRVAHIHTSQIYIRRRWSLQWTRKGSRQPIRGDDRVEGIGLFGVFSLKRNTSW